MRHFDAWLVRDPYSIWHYYSTGHRWKDTVRDLIHDRSICSPSTSTSTSTTTTTTTTTLDWTTHTPQTTPLLTQLPPEIRQMIWAYVFGSDTLHLVQIKDKIRHVRCPSPSEPSTTSALTHHRHCCPLTPARWRTYDGRIPGHTDRLLFPHTHEHLPDSLSTGTVSLLRTCKAIHAETAAILYNNNTIDVDDLYTFIAFYHSLSPRARKSIRHLTIQWTPVWTPFSGQDHSGSIYAHTHSDALWVEFWNCVASLHLHTLGLSIDLGRYTGAVSEGGVVLVNGQKLGLSIEEEWVRPLLAVRGLRGFELAVTARCDAVSRGVVEGELVKDALRLREELRGVLMGGRVEMDIEESAVKMEGKRRGKRRLAITAA